MSRAGNCSASPCGSAAIVSLDQQALCLSHFLSYCYQRLEVLDPRNRKLPAGPVRLVEMRAFIEDCSRKALDISLHAEDLTNLQRGRLLDILLWAGELFVLLRAPRILFPDSLASSLDEATSSEYERPLVFRKSQS